MKISTHIIYITYKIVYEFGVSHSVVLEKLLFGKKVYKILTSNISQICPKELDRELSKIYFYKKFWSDWVIFTPAIVVTQN